MTPSENLEDVIVSSIEDVDLPLEEPDLEASADLPEASPEPQTTASEVTTDPVDSAVPEAPEVKSPASKEAGANGDDFEKRFGIPQNSATGRENRIPYSRVKKITEKAEKEAIARLTGEYTPKITDFETKLKDYETKVADYEGRLTKVAEFEHIMMNDHVKFIGMLAQIPQYAQIFAPLYEQAEPKAEAPAAPDLTAEPRPDPDMTLADGSKAYSMEGLDKLNAWNRAQAAAEARKQVMAEVDKAYGPILLRQKAEERMQEALPKVQAQIAEARKWPQFNENEAEIVKALNADPSLTLDGAYNRVVVPKLATFQTEATTNAEELRKKIRAEVLEELKKTPRNTSAGGGAGKPAARQPASGPRNLESVIEDAIQSLKK